MTLAASEVGPRRLVWPFHPAFLPAWYLWIGGSWWHETVAIVRSTPLAPGDDDPARLAALALTGRVLATLSEAGVYALWSTSRGTPLPYWRLLAWIASLSTLDLFASVLRRAAIDAPEGVRVLFAMLAGPAALEASPVAETGAMAVFGGVGLLALLRVAMTGWAVARGAGRPLATPMMGVGGAWLLTRCAGWWAFDLVKGLSPV